MEKTITIKCPDCKNKLFRYRKTGKGSLLRMYYSCILKNWCIEENNEVSCPKCGHRIGIKDSSFIRFLGKLRVD